MRKRKRRKKRKKNRKEEGKEEGGVTKTTNEKKNFNARERDIPNIF